MHLNFMHLYCPGAVEDTPQGVNFQGSKKPFINLVVCCKFKNEDISGLHLAGFTFLNLLDLLKCLVM